MCEIHNFKLKSVINKCRANVQNKMIFKRVVHSMQRYRELIAFRLYAIFVPQCLCNDVNCMHSDHRILIDKYCNDFVKIVKTAVSEAVSQYRLHKTFWEPLLVDLKSRYIRTHSDRVAEVKPRHGMLHQQRMDARHEYKRAILDCMKHFMRDSSNIFSKFINSHDKKNFLGNLK